MKDKLLKILENKDLIALLDKQLAQNKETSLAHRFANNAKSLRSPEFIIPVLGTQGSGKSSLLNALLLDDIILPVDADETTCIPTEIRYGKNTQPEAEVIFQTGQVRKVECSAAGLEQYVHQKDNPGNKMGVEKISISLNHPLLKNGIILVDLPGVGSITAANLKTTTEFIKKSTGAIFLLRTTPPITSSEATFIQGCWPLMANTFFLQNQWTDENDEAVEDGKSYSLAILKKIAQSCQLPTDNIEISVTGVYQALNAKIYNNQQALSKSGLPQFVAKLEAFTNNWQQSITSQICANTLETIQQAQAQLNDRIELAAKSAEQQKSELLKRQNEFKAELEDKKQLAGECFNQLDDARKVLNKNITETCKFSAENFRNNIREVINSGVTGGNQLNKAFKDLHQEQLELIFSQLQPQIIKFTREIAEKIDTIGNFDFQNISLDGNAAFSEKSNAHEFYNNAGSAGGALGGAALGAALFSWSGPGAVIAGAIGGIIGGLLGTFAGNKAKEFHIEQQQEEARRELISMVDDFRKSTEKGYKEQIASLLGEVEKTVNSWLEQSESQFNDKQQQLFSLIEQSEKNRSAVLKELQNELVVFDGYAKELGMRG